MDDALAARVDRLDEHLRRRDLRAAWFLTDAGLAWLLGTPPGRDAAGRRAVAAGYVRDDGRVRAVVDSGEADRLQESVFPDGVDVERVEWYESSPLDVAVRSTPRPAAADVSVPGFESLDGPHLRLPLFDDDVAKFRRLGRETAAAVERVCRELRPEDSEHEVAAGVRIGLATDGVKTVSLRVAGERSGGVPRPTPTDAALGDHTTVAVTAERDGRHVSLARTVAFDPPAGFGAAHEAAASVAAAGTAAAAEVADSGRLFAAMRDAYAAVGQPEAWRTSPPGGAVGYEPREWLVEPDGERPIRGPCALAVTPRVDGALYGDTVLVGRDGSVERLTDSGGWPTTDREEGVVAPLVR